MILVIEDFDTAPYNIPDTDDIENTLLVFIDEQERDFYRKIFGRPFSDSLQLAYDNSVLEVGAVALTERWDNIINGAEYQYNDLTYTWDGLKAAVKPYVYSRWVKEEMTRLTSSGEVSGKSENAVKENPGRRIVNAWNESFRLIGKRGLVKDTLYGLLYYSETIYDDVVAAKGYTSFQDYLLREFKTRGTMNVFNL